LSTQRRPRNLPAARPNPLRDLVTQKSRAAEAARERKRVQELRSELPSIIQNRVGEQIDELENKLLNEVKELSQRTIEESAAAISRQLNGRIETLEKVSQLQTETLESLRDSSRIAEQKVSLVVDQIERSLSGSVPGGFALEPSKLPPMPETGDVSPAPQIASPNSYSQPVPQLPGSIQVSDTAPLRLKMPPMPVGERLSFFAPHISSTGIHPQFLPEPPMEVVEADPVDVTEVLGRHGFCPNCTSLDVRRANRRGIFEAFLRLFSIAPFRCRACRHKFYRF
jgi:hypothetical protein